MIAIKTFFLQKNSCMGFYRQQLEIIKETEKAVLIRCFLDNDKFEQWVPKSVLIDEWEKDTSNFGYRNYLLDISCKHTDKLQGYYLPKMTTKQLQEALEKHEVKFMTRSEWNTR